MTKKIELSNTTIQAIKEARTRRPWFADETDDGIIFHILTEWLSKDGEQTVNDWLREFF